MDDEPNPLLQKMSTSIKGVQFCLVIVILGIAGATLDPKTPGCIVARFTEIG